MNPYPRQSWLFGPRVFYTHQALKLIESIVERVELIAPDPACYAEAMARYAEAKDRAWRAGQDLEHQVLVEHEARLHERVIAMLEPQAA